MAVKRPSTRCGDHHHLTGECAQWRQHTVNDRDDIKSASMCSLNGFHHPAIITAQINRNDQLQRRTKSDILYLLKAVEVEGGIVAAQSNWQQGKPTPLHFAKQRLSVRFTNAQVLRLLRRLVQSRQHLVVIPAAWRMGAIEHPFLSFANQRSATP